LHLRFGTVSVIVFVIFSLKLMHIIETEQCCWQGFVAQ